MAMNGNQGHGLDRLPPQAVEVEQAVLGAMLLDGRAVGRAIELLDAEAFYHGPHARIYSAMLSLYERNEAVDQLTVGEELKRRAQLDECGGVVYLIELASGVASSANIVHHCEIVLQRAMSRGLIETAAEVQSRAFAGDNPSVVVEWAEQRLFFLGTKRRTGRQPVLLEQAMHDTFEQIEKAHQRQAHVTGIDTGFSDLNDITSGFQASTLIILASRPGAGKTAMVLGFARKAADACSVLIYSLEMSISDLVQRLLSAEAMVDLHRMRTGKLRDADWHQLSRHVGRLAQAPIYIDDTPGITMSEARSKSRMMQRQHGIGLVVLDYMQLMGVDQEHRGRSREQQVAEMSKGLKGLAREMEIPVIALSQLSRATEAREDRRPQLSDLRESGSLEADADVVIFIYRPDMYRLKGKDGASLEGVAEIIIAKQRMGPTGSVHLMWKKESASFENLAPEFRIEEYEQGGMI